MAERKNCKEKDQKGGRSVQVEGQKTKDEEKRKKG